MNLLRGRNPMHRRATLWGAFLLLTLPAAAQVVDGLWDATVTVNGTPIPFRMEFSGAGRSLKGWFFNGDERIVSTGGEAAHGSIVARFDQYNSRLEAVLKHGVLQGRYLRDGKVYPFRASRFKASPAPTGTVPSIDGSWVIQTGNQTGEKAWRLVVRQSGTEVSGAILRVDGDTGVLSGRYANGGFTMSHFSGARPSLFVLTPAAEGSLTIVQNGKQKFTAVRADEARSKGLAEPDDPMQHTTLRDPSVPLRFSFPDLRGQIVSNADARFVGKVVIVSIGGSWCPNCHDEAPLLVDIYRKYRDKGLEIVLLSFEETEQLANPTRLREFIKEYGIEYPVLLAGTPEQLSEKLPQAVNLDTFPATFLIGRDGLVRAIHSGFAGRAMGDLHDQLVAELITTIEEMLAETIPRTK